MPGKCATDKVVYRATVTTAEKTETYVGMTMNQFKDRWSIHDGDFKDPERRINTELSSYVWDLKDQNTQYEIRWDLVRRANPFHLLQENVISALQKSLRLFIIQD